MNLNRQLNLTLFALLTTFSLSSCATTGSVRKVHNEAKDASLLASQANLNAKQALETALEAQRTALAAETRARQTEEMLNRGFERSMRK